VVATVVAQRDFIKERNMKNINVKHLMTRVSYYAIPVVQTIAASVGVILVMRCIDRIAHKICR
jgi:hypothetical protein